jgi:hypothetical protein
VKTSAPGARFRGCGTQGNLGQPTICPDFFRGITIA